MAVTVNAAIIDEKDTVVVAIEKINSGDEIIWRDRNGDVQKITAATDVPMYHKVAIKEMPKGTEDACVFNDSRRKLRDENIYDPSWRDGLE